MYPWHVSFGVEKVQAISSGTSLVLAPPIVDQKSGATKISVKYSGVDHFCYIQIVLSTAKPKPEIYNLYNGVTRDGQCIGSPANPVTLTHVFTGLKPGANTFVAGAQYRESASPVNIDSNKQTVTLPTTYKPIQPPPAGTDTKPPVTTVPGNLPVPAGNGTEGNPELAPGANSSGSEGAKPATIDKGEECPLTTGGLTNWFKDNFLMKPICAATNLIASAATAIASWTITTFFEPALGLT